MVIDEIDTLIWNQPKGAIQTKGKRDKESSWHNSTLHGYEMEI